MTFCCEGKEDCLFFDLKIKTEFYISKMKNILIKLGISSLKRADFYDPISFYIYSQFDMNMNNSILLDSIELDKLDGKFFNIDKVSDKFSFDSKVKCKLIFLNFNKIIQKKVEEDIRLHPAKISTKRLYLKLDGVKNTYYDHLISEYLTNYSKEDDFLKSDCGFYENIFWKNNKIKISIDSEGDDNDEDEDDFEIIRKSSKSKAPSQDISRTGSISDFGNFNCINYTDRTFRTKRSFLDNSKDLLISTKMNSIRDIKDKERMSIFENIDIIENVLEHSGTINYTKTFSYKELPDTRNTRKMNKDIITRVNSYLETNLHMNNVRLKDIVWLVFVIIFIFIILKFFAL
jgi:hypothetical protein